MKQYCGTVGHLFVIAAWMLIGAADGFRYANAAPQTDLATEDRTVTSTTAAIDAYKRALESGWGRLLRSHIFTYEQNGLLRDPHTHHHLQEMVEKQVTRTAKAAKENPSAHTQAAAEHFEDVRFRIGGQSRVDPATVIGAEYNRRFRFQV